MKMRQEDVAGQASASFLSKVENGVAQPSLNNLKDWSDRLDTTAADLLGDHLVLEAAKHCVLLTEKCHGYLDQLRPSPITFFLRELSASATALSISVPDPPANSELEYLTAKVLLHRGEAEKARDMVEQALHLTHPPLLRIRYLSLLCLIYSKLAHGEKKEEVLEDFRSDLLELDHHTLLYSLPDADALSTDDLALLKLSSFIKDIRQV